MNSMKVIDVQRNYLRHDEINQFLDNLEQRFSRFVKVHIIGESYEGRQIKAIEIGNCNKQRSESLSKDESSISNTKEKKRPKKKKIVPLRDLIFIEAGAHAREWMTIAVAINCIHQLTENYHQHRDILDKLRFLIVPVVNPDGYEYTCETNPNWRKNRRPNEEGNCIGTDCNRNYDIHWDKGTSKESRNTFKGQAAFSEPETCAVRNALLQHQQHLLLFLSLHAYAQSIMYPWGYTRELPLDWRRLQKLAESGRNAIKQMTGRTYRCGSISGVRKRIYTGTVVDYVYGVIQAPLALVMELPSSKFGFQPGREYIRPIGNESWAGIKAMSRCAYELEQAVVAERSIIKPVIIKKKRKRLVV